MKKILPALLVLLALGAAGATVYLFQRPGGVHGNAAGAAAGYLPAETLLLLSVPDPEQTATDWKTTDVYKLWREPSVQAFFAKPLSKVPPNQDFNDALAQVGRVGPSNLFVALTALDPKTSQPHGLAGFRFKSAKSEVEQLLNKPKEWLRQGWPAAKSDLVPYQDATLETYTNPDGQLLASVYLNDWYFVSNDLALLKATVDRVEHRAPSAPPALEGDADFKTVLAKLPATPATLVFARPQVAFERLISLAVASGSQGMSEEQQAELRKIKAVGATTSIENGKLRDTIYSFAPGHQQPKEPLKLDALPLTSPDTLLFYAGVLRLPESGAKSSAAASKYAALFPLFSQLQAQGLTMDRFNAAYGHELAGQLDWPAASNQPALVLSLDVRDPAAAAKLLDDVLKAVPYRTLETAPAPGDSPGTDPFWQVTKQEGLTFRTLVLPTVKVVSPTLTLTDKHLLVGLSLGGVEAAAAHEKTGGPDVTASEAYKTASALVSKPNLATTFIDTKPLFERTYALLKPFAMFGAAFAGPQVNDTVDFTKLPDGDAIAKHLSPIVLSEKTDDQGTLVESVGPLTFIQATFGLGGAAGATAAPFLQKQFAAKAAAAMPTPDDEAGATAPAATPQPTAGE